MFFGQKHEVDAVARDLQRDLLLKLTGALSEGENVAFLRREIRRTSEGIELYMKSEYIDRVLELDDMKSCRQSAVLQKPAIARQPAVPSTLFRASAAMLFLRRKPGAHLRPEMLGEHSEMRSCL